MNPYLIKVNIPYDEAGYRSGNGEGVFVEVDEQTKRAHDENQISVTANFCGILLNDSLYYPKLLCGMKLPFEMRGEKRGIVPLDFLSDKGRLTKEELHILKRNVATMTNFNHGE